MPLEKLAQPGASDPDWYPAMVMSHVLGGGGFAARLMKKIRSDEGLTYGVRTQLGEMQRLKDEPLTLKPIP